MSWNELPTNPPSAPLPTLTLNSIRLYASKQHLPIARSPNLINEAVRQAMQEDRADLAAFAEREGELTMTYEERLNDVHERGKL